MDATDFTEFGRASIDFIVNYLENIRDKQVLPSVEPGYLQPLLPKELPEQPEKWQDVLKDMERVIMPGITHWQSPNFHAYYPTPASYPSIVGEMLSAGLGVVGFNWIASPACTELEMIVMDWLGRFLDLPTEFLHSSEGPGGGVIQGTACESTLVAILAARERTVRRLLDERPELTESDIRGKLIAYSSDQSNSMVERCGILAAVPMKLLKSNEGVLTGAILQEAIDRDLENGNIPIICVATLGTTASCAYDDLESLGPICKDNKMWLHVDAAYAGSALCCPEFRPLMRGIELTDSINVNLHKWMMVNFDCCAMWLKNSDDVVDAFTVNRIYLEHKHQGKSTIPDYRHWQIPLGRRFRALKVWIVLRTIGAENIRESIRHHVRLAEHFENCVKTDNRFEIVAKRSMGLVCFRLKGECNITRDLLERITERKLIYMVPATLNNQIMIRFVICGKDPKERDINFAWQEIQSQADELLKSIQPVTVEILEPALISFSKNFTFSVDASKSIL